MEFAVMIFGLSAAFAVVFVGLYFKQLTKKVKECELCNHSDINSVVKNNNEDKEI